MATDTQVKAFESIVPVLGRVQDQVLTVIRDYYSVGRGGAICSEIMEETGLRWQTASTRFAELRRLGLIEDSGERRPGESGRKQIVWRPIQ